MALAVLPETPGRFYCLHSSGEEGGIELWSAHGAHCKSVFVTGGDSFLHHLSSSSCTLHRQVSWRIARDKAIVLLLLPH